jgi:hypothetical protein
VFELTTALMSEDVNCTDGASVVTITCSVVDPIFMWKSNVWLVPTVRVTSAPDSTNPGAAAVSRYWPGTRLGATYKPPESDATVRTIPVAVFVIEIFASVKTRPEGSVTLPETVAPATWAYTRLDGIKTTTAAKTQATTRTPIQFKLFTQHPPRSAANGYLTIIKLT